MTLRRLARALSLSLVALALPGGAAALWISPDLSPGTVATVGVVLNDEAAEACWTNLGEVRDYARDKLRLAGYAVAEDADYTLYITVNAARLARQGPCYGNIDLMLAAPESARGVSGVHAVALHSNIFVNSENANIVVIETLRGFVEALAR